MDVKFKFSLEQSVTIVPNGMPGKVIGLAIDRDQTHWTQVQYSDAAKMVHDAYFRESDLS